MIYVQRLFNLLDFNLVFGLLQNLFYENTAKIKHKTVVQNVKFLKITNLMEQFQFVQLSYK